MYYDFFAGKPYSRPMLEELSWILYGFIECETDYLSDTLRLCDSDYIQELEDFFPAHLIRENQKLCVNALLDLSEWTKDGYYHEMTSVHEYALYRILQNEFDYLDELPHEEALKFRHVAFDIPHPDKLSKEELEIIDEMRSSSELFIDNLFWDTDFEILDLITTMFQERNPLFLNLGVNLEYYMPLMPADIRSSVHKMLCDKEEGDEVGVTLKAIHDVIRDLEGKPRHLEELSEEEINGRIASGLRFVLRADNIEVFQEIPYGYAPKKTGEVDFCLFRKDVYETPLAIGEGKFWGKFQDQVEQLIGYMNEHVKLGFTVVINKSRQLAEIRKKQENILLHFQGDGGSFKVLEINQSDFGCISCLHKHPETDEYFMSCHFVLNLYHPERKQAASQRSNRF